MAPICPQEGVSLSMAAPPSSTASASSFHPPYHHPSPCPAHPHRRRMPTHMHTYIFTHMCSHSHSGLRPNPVSCRSQKAILSCHEHPSLPLSHHLSLVGLFRLQKGPPLEALPEPPGLGQVPSEPRDLCSAPSGALTTLHDNSSLTHLSPLPPVPCEVGETECWHSLDIC